MKAESVRCVAIVVLVLCVNFEFTSAEEWEDFICFGHPTDTIIAHPTECNLFFECDGGVGSQNQCPPNSFFNPEINECDPNYQCNLPGSTTTTSYPYITTPMKPTKPTKPTNASNHTIKCPTNDTTMVTFLANPNNCSEYFMCYYGKPLRFVCPRRYEFSAADKACIPAKQSTCNIQPSHPSHNPVCPQGIRRFYPHPRSCENFVYCENGVKSIQRCQPFYHWDVTSKRCKLRGRAICIENVPVALRRAFY